MLEGLSVSEVIMARQGWQQNLEWFQLFFFTMCFGMCMNEFSFWVGALLGCLLNSHKNVVDDTGPVIAHQHHWLCHHCSG